MRLLLPRQRGSTLTRVLLVLFTLAVIGSLFALGFALAQTQDRNVRVFPDGTRLEFLGVRIGAAQFSTEKPWEKWMRKYLPAGMTRGLPPAISGVCGFGTNSITAYFRVVSVSAKSPPWDSYSCEDDHGFLHQRQGGYCSFGRLQSVYGLTLQSFPRRQKHFWFTFSDSKGQHLARFRLRNPFPGPFPDWQPQPLPQARTNGPVTLVLKSAKRSGQAHYHFLEAEWEVTSNNPLWKNARPGMPRLFDPTGNEGSWLSPREKTWKLETRLHRPGFEPFLPEERLVITNMVFPQSEQPTILDYSGVVSGVGVTLQLIAPPGKLTISNGVVLPMIPVLPVTPRGGHSLSSGDFGTVETWEKAKPFALFTVTGIQEHDSIRCRLMDEHGTFFEGNTSGYQGAGAGRRVYTPVFEIPDPPERVTFELVVSRPLQFEFLISPSDVTIP